MKNSMQAEEEQLGMRNFQKENLDAFFAAQNAAKNRAFRSNSSARHGGLAGFPLQSRLAWTGNNFAKQNYDQPLARPRGGSKTRQGNCLR
jgi:hypothetical protein